MKLNHIRGTSLLHRGSHESHCKSAYSSAHLILKCKPHVPGTQNSFTTDAWILLVGAILALSLLGLTLVASYVLNEPISTFTRDPMAVAQGRSYYGLISNVGAILWSFSTAVCLFSYWALHQRIDRSDSLRNFILLGGLISLVLLADDLFMLHESVYPQLFFVSENVTFAGYGLILLFYLARFWSIIRQTGYLPLASSGFFLALSVGIDQLPEDLMVFHHLIEDGAKLFGIVSWLGYQLSVCASAVQCPRRRAGNPLGRH
jgi:hypothetical protein